MLVLLALLLGLAACGGDDGGDAAEHGGEKAGASADGDTSASAGASREADGPCSYPDDGTEPAKEVDPPPAKPVTEKPTTAVLRTGVGNIKVTLDADKAPCTVNSFLSLAEQGYFDDTRCHRLTTQGIYVLQCGDPEGTGAGGPGYSFADELLDGDPRLQPCQQMQGQNVCTYGPGTLAMANAGPDTNGSQFFLVYDSSPLPAAYTVFGRMDAAGLNVVEKVAQGGIDQAERGPTDGSPKTEVKITGVTVR